MTTVVAGTDTYGRVKAVRGVPIVTRFATLQMLPLYPLQSFYFLGLDESDWRTLRPHYPVASFDGRGKLCRAIRYVGCSSS
jgi:hypothetical protein